MKGDLFFNVINSDVHILWLYNIMDRIYKYNPDVSYKPNGGRYLQLITAKDLYIQNITVAEHNSHSDSFQVKFPNVFTNYPLGAARVEDSKIQRLGPLQINSMAIGTEFCSLLCIRCLWSICGASQC